MKRIVIAAFALFVVAPAYSQTIVKPYIKRDGTLVMPHLRSAPNNTPYDNYSYRPRAVPNYAPPVYVPRYTPRTTAPYQPYEYRAPRYNPPTYNPPSYKAPSYGDPYSYDEDE